MLGEEEVVVVEIEKNKNKKGKKAAETPSWSE